MALAYQKQMHQVSRYPIQFDYNYYPRATVIIVQHSFTVLKITKTKLAKIKIQNY